MPQLLRRLLSLAVSTLAGVLIVVALLFSLARALLPMVDQYQYQIVSWAEARTGLTLSVGRLSLDWKGWAPRLVLHDTEITDPQSGQRQQVDYIALSPDWLASLRSLDLVLGELTLGGVQLVLSEDEAGRIYFLSEANGVAAANSGERDFKPMTLLSRLHQISVEQLSLQFQSAGGQLISLIDNGSLQARYADGRWRAQLIFTASEISPRSLRVKLDLAQRDQFEGRLYVRATELNLSRLQQWLAMLGPVTWRGQIGACRGVDIGDCTWALPEIDHGKLAGEFWMHISDAAITQITAAFRLDDLVATRLHNGRVPVARSRLKSLEGKLRWRAKPENEQGWSLIFDELLLDDGQQRWPTQQVWIEQAGTTFRASADYLRLASLRTWLAVSPVPEAIQRLLADASPSGLVCHLHLMIEKGRVTHGYMRLEDMRFRGSGFLPSIGLGEHDQGGLSADIYKYPAGWIVHLDEQDLTLDFHDEFRAPIHLTRLKGVIYWLEGEDIRFFSPKLELHTADLESQSQFDLLIPVDAPPVIRLETQFGQIASRRVPDYLPRQKLSPAVLNWLDHALVGEGQVPKGRFVLSGDLSRFPFDRGGGYFEVRYDFDGLELPYAPNWPPATSLHGEMAFINQSFVARIDGGEVAGSRVEGGQVEIASFASPAVQVNLDVVGPLAAQLNFLEQSPILKPNSLDWLQVDGDSRLALDINIPLYSEGRGHERAKGQLILENAELSMPALGVRVTNLRGPVRFVNERIDARGITGRVDGETVQIGVTTTAEQEQTQTRVDVDGRLDPLLALRKLDHPLASQVRGKAKTLVSMTIPHHFEQVPTRIEVTSDLVGVSFDFPEPLAKPESVALNSQTRVILTQGRATEVQATLGDMVAGRLGLTPSGDGILALRLHLGGGSWDPAMPDAQVTLSGSVDRLDLLQWLDWLDASGGGEATLGNAERKSFMPIRGQVRVGELRAGILQLHQADIALDMVAQDWRYRIDSNEAAGDLRLVLDAQQRISQLRGQFDYLTLSGAGAEYLDDEVEPNSALSPLDVNRLPSVSLVVDRLRYEAYELGQFHIEAGQPADTVDEWRISRLRLGEPGMFEVLADGRMWRDAGDLRTELRVSLHSDDAGRTLMHLNNSAAMQGGRLQETAFTLNWPGSLFDYDMGKVQGQGQFSIVNGRLRDVDAGAGRILGLLSIGALTRRLKLDFRDIVSEGFFFDSIVGKLELQDGKLWARPIEIRSPSLFAVINGHANLLNDSLDYELDIYADVGMLLPLIGTVAGGPLVGGAVLLLQKLVRQGGTDLEPDKRYRITGSIDQPVLERNRE